LGGSDGVLGIGPGVTRGLSRLWEKAKGEQTEGETQDKAKGKEIGGGEIKIFKKTPLNYGRGSTLLCGGEPKGWGGPFSCKRAKENEAQKKKGDIRNKKLSS